MSRTIIIRGQDRCVRQEATSAGTITPGHLIRLDSNGKFAVHNVAGGDAEKMFAAENEVFGDGVTTNYAADDRVLAWVTPPGVEVYALLPANAAAVAIGDFLESNGDGTLRKSVGLTDSSGGTANTTLQDIGAAHVEAEIANNFADVAAAINRSGLGRIAVALEAVDNSAVAAVARIRVRIL